MSECSQAPLAGAQKQQAPQHLVSTMINSSYYGWRTQEIRSQKKQLKIKTSISEFAHNFNSVSISALLGQKMQCEWVTLQSLTKLTNKSQMFEKILQCQKLQRKSLLTQSYWVNLKQV